MDGAAGEFVVILGVLTGLALNNAAAGEVVLRAFAGLSVDGTAAGEFVVILGAFAGLGVNGIAAGDVILGAFAGLSVDGTVDCAAGEVVEVLGRSEIIFTLSSTTSMFSFALMTAVIARVSPRATTCTSMTSFRDGNPVGPERKVAIPSKMKSNPICKRRWRVSPLP